MCDSRSLVIAEVRQPQHGWKNVPAILFEKPKKIDHNGLLITGLQFKW